MVTGAGPAKPLQNQAWISEVGDSLKPAAEIRAQPGLRGERRVPTHRHVCAWGDDSVEHMVGRRENLDWMPSEEGSQGAGCIQSQGIQRT